MIIYNAGVCLKIGRVALRAEIYTRFQFYIYFFKMLYKVTLLIYIVTCLRGFAIRFFIIAELHKISVLHLFLQNVSQNLVRSTSKSVTLRCFCYFHKVTLLIYIVNCLRGFAIRFFIIAAFIIVAAFIFHNPFGMSWDCYMRTQF